MPKKKIFTHPAEAEKAFYESFSNGDLDAMMEVWAPDEEIICVQPTGVLLTGYEQVREGWAQLLTSTSGQLSIAVTVHQQVDGVMIAVHHVTEEITVKDNDKTEKGQTLAVNVFLRTPDGWRLLIHQATLTNDKALNQTLEPSPTLH